MTSTMTGTLQHEVYRDFTSSFIAKDENKRDLFTLDQLLQTSAYHILEWQHFLLTAGCMQ
jgi:hypothetical protein